MTSPHRGAREPSGVGYYGVPVIHRPHWRWLIVGYFFFGGIAGSAAVLSAFMRLLAGERATGMARVATHVSIVALVPCPLLLILDLGRPGRFLNMLRVLRLSSPMSLGTWGLTLFGIAMTLQTLVHIRHDVSRTADFEPGNVAPPRIKALSVVGGISGFFVAGYTGVLLSATAVPLWSKRPALLAPLFLSSAMSSGAAAVAAAAAIISPPDEATEEALRRIEVISALAEGSLLVAWLDRLGSTAKPLNHGLMGYVVREGAGAAGVAAPLLLHAVAPSLPRRCRRAATIAASALTLLGVFALRYAVVEGGRRSADDPGATFELTG